MAENDNLKTLAMLRAVCLCSNDGGDPVLADALEQLDAQGRTVALKVLARNFERWATEALRPDLNAVLADALAKIPGGEATTR